MKSRIELAISYLSSSEARNVLKTCNVDHHESDSRDELLNKILEGVKTEKIPVEAIGA